MTEARKLQDRLTQAVQDHDIEAILACYHPDAVAVTPEGTFRGRDEIASWVRAQFEAFPDFAVTVDAKLDGEGVALDESTITGTHTGPLPLPNGGSIPPTGRRVAQRSADAAVARDGLIVEHRFYYDQLEVLAQLEAELPSLQPSR